MEQNLEDFEEDDDLFFSKHQQLISNGYQKNAIKNDYSMMSYKMKQDFHLDSFYSRQRSNSFEAESPTLRHPLRND